MKNIEKLVKPHVMKLVPYQPGKPIETLARELGIAQDCIAKMASNESPMGPSPKAVDAMKAAASEMQLYPDGACLQLKDKLATHYGLSADHFAVGAGSNELIELLGLAFLNPENGIVMSQYSFAVYRLVAKLFRAPCTEVPATSGFGHDVRGMIRASKQKNVRMVFICNPNNPTGTFLNRRELSTLISGIPEDVLVVLDEAYAEIAIHRRFPETVSLLNEHPNLLILRTFSKAYGLAGLRIGYAMGSPNVVKMFERVRQPFNVNRMAQIAACAALDDHEFVKQSVIHYRCSASLFYDFFGKVGLHYIPTVTNFLLVNVGDGQAMFEKLEKQGLITRPMGAYNLKEWLRISFGTTEENRRLIDTMSAILTQGL